MVIYINMYYNYVNMRLFYVNMQDNYVDIQHELSLMLTKLYRMLT